MRARRWAVPVPATYLWAALIGIVLGVGLDLVLGWPWWLVAGAFVAAVALVFLSTAFCPRDRHRTPLAIDLLRVRSPARARERTYLDEVERFKAAPFPLYGLPPAWSGPRFLAGWGSGWAAGERPVSTMLGLAHGDPSVPDAPMLRVEVESDPMPEHHRRRRLAAELRNEVWPQGRGAADTMWPSPPLASEGPPAPQWTGVVIPVDGRSVTFGWLAEGSRWVAHASFDGCTVILRGQHLPLGSVELVRITDLEPYLKGRRRFAEILDGHDLADP